MRKNVYISADYAENNGDREVVELLKKWGTDDLHKVNFIDMAGVASGSISEDGDCRPCDLKAEFNKQINASSVVILVIGDKTALRTAGSNCRRSENGKLYCTCTPYKQNSKGSKFCKVDYTCEPINDIGNINNYSYLRHEFEQARKRNKIIVILYNSLRKEVNWLPSYMKEYESIAQPFWIKNDRNEKVGNYSYIKEVLGFV